MSDNSKKNSHQNITELKVMKSRIEHQQHVAPACLSPAPFSHCRIQMVINECKSGFQHVQSGSDYILYIHVLHHEHSHPLLWAQYWLSGVCDGASKHWRNAFLEPFSVFLAMAGSLELQNSRCFVNTPPTAGERHWPLVMADITLFSCAGTLAFEGSGVFKFWCV